MHHVISPIEKSFCCLSLAVGLKIGIVLDIISLSLYVMTYYTIATTGVEFVLPNQNISG